MTIIRNTLTCLVVASLMTGCATGRIADLRDCGRLSCGLGIGLGAEVSLGALGNPSLGLISHTGMCGFEDRTLAGSWHEYQTFAVLGSMVHSIFYGELDPLDYSREMGWGGAWRQRPMFLPLRRDDCPETSTFQVLTDFECGATLGIVSARVGINPLEIVDFVLGFVGFDIAKDDPKEAKEKPTKKSTLSSEGAPSDER